MGKWQLQGSVPSLLPREEAGQTLPLPLKFRTGAHHRPVLTELCNVVLLCLDQAQ